MRIHSSPARRRFTPPEGKYLLKHLDCESIRVGILERHQGCMSWIPQRSRLPLQPKSEGAIDPTLQQAANLRAGSAAAQNRQQTSIGCFTASQKLHRKLPACPPLARLCGVGVRVGVGGGEWGRTCSFAGTVLCRNAVSLYLRSVRSPLLGQCGRPSPA